MAARVLLGFENDYAELANADIVIEAVFESLEIKKSVFAKLDAVCKTCRHPGGEQHLDPRYRRDGRDD